MTTTETTLLTADDLLRLDSEGVRGELIRGVLHETMPAGKRHGRIVTNLVFELVSFTRPRQLGVVVASGSGVLLERDPDTVRDPDIGFTSVERAPLDDDTPGYAEVPPDLVVEVVSPSDKPPEVNAKASMWLSFGVRLVWVVYPETRTVDVHREGRGVETLDEDDALDGLDVLPGFRCPLRAVFDV